MIRTKKTKNQDKDLLKFLFTQLSQSEKERWGNTFESFYANLVNHKKIHEELTK